MRARNKERAPITEALRQDNALALLGKTAESEERVTVRDALQLPLTKRHVDAALIAIIALLATWGTQSLHPIQEEVIRAVTHKLQPLFEDKAVLTANPTLGTRTSAAPAALRDLGPASATEAAMKEIARFPNGASIAVAATEALQARKSDEGAKKFLEKYGFTTTAPTLTVEPKMSPRWQPAFQELTASISPDGTTSEEAIERFYSATVVADRGEEEARQMLASMGDTPNSPAGKVLVETKRKAAQAEWAHRICQTPRDFQELALAGLRQHLAGKSPQWVETPPLPDAPVPTPSLAASPLTNEGTPSKICIVLGEDHELATREDYKTLIDALHQKGIRHLSLELPANSIVQGAQICETRDYAIKKGWVVESVDMSVPQMKARNEEAATILRWSTNANSTNKPILETLAKANAGDTVHLRSQYMGFNLAKKSEGTLHIGGSAHMADIQDAVAAITGSRPLGVEIDYGKENSTLKALHRDAAASKNAIRIKKDELATTLANLLPAPQKPQPAPLAGPKPTI